MSGGRSLVEKFLKASVERDSTYSSRARKKELTESVLHHLRDLLNSRQGCCQVQAEFGMPELENRGEGLALFTREIEEHIRQVVLRFEPRLRQVQVRAIRDDEGDLRPRFSIHAQLAERDIQDKEVVFSTVVDPVGKILIA